ncbi:plasmid recombination protein [[Ruminococcus] lactaris]|uniref:plasmid recombination protein n=1 Tax=[Ruminococcus] lactaris TaxID=46228 RepID=UPI003FD8B4DA
MAMKRTISGMIGAGSLAHNRRAFVAENVDRERVHLNIKYCDENLKTVYHELFDQAVERYNEGKRNDRKITDYYEKIRQGKQEKLFHEVIFQIGNRENMAVGTSEGNLAVKVLDEYVQDFKKRNPTLRVFSCYLHQDEATPHLHIDFVPYVTNWKGKGMDTRVSLKQALKSLGFQGGNKHDTELNQWINHEKEVLAEIAKQHGIEWEQKGTHEEHLDVYNFKNKERKKEVQELEQEKENLTAENEGLTSQIADARADIKLLEEEKIQFQKDKEIAEKRAEKAETELKKLEDRREFLQPVMDTVSKEIKEYGMIKTFLPEAIALERAVTYRDKKIKPLFIEMKNKISAMAAQVKELTRERDNWKSKFQKKKKEYENTKKELAEVQKDYQKLSGEKEILQGLADRYNRLLRMLGTDMVERLVQDDIRMQAELEAKKQKEQMPKKISDRIPWAKERSEEHNAQIKKNKAKYRGMEL